MGYIVIDIHKPMMGVAVDDDLLNYETVERHYDQTSMSEAIPID